MSYAQDGYLFRVIPHDTDLLNEEEKVIAERAKNGSRFTEGWTVSLADLEDVPRLESSIQLPDVDGSFSITSKHSSYLEQTYLEPTRFNVWSGRIDHLESNGEFLVLRSDQGALGALLQFDGAIFELLPINRKAGILRRVNPEFSKGRNCAVGLDDREGRDGFNTSSLLSTPSPCSMFSQNCTKRRWRILIGYTQETIDWNLAANGYLGANLLVGLTKATFDITLQNSNITNIPNIEYVDINIGTFNHSGNIGIDLDGARVLGNSYESIYNQDRFVLMTIYDYGGISGIADLPYSSNSGQYIPTKDAAVVNFMTVWYPELTFAHELGHTFGANHDNASTIFGPPNLVDCYRGTIFGNGGIDRTVMATLFSNNSVSSSSSAMVFSDPTNTYEYNGQQVSIGNASRDNTNVVQYTLCYEGVDPQSAQQTYNAYFPQRNSYSITDISSLYPNPAYNMIYISNTNELNSIKFITIDGKVVREVEQPDRISSLDISSLKSGAYFIRLQYATSVETIKFVKQ